MIGGGILALLGILAIDTAPVGAPSPVPSAKDAEAAKALLLRARRAMRGKNEEPLTASWPEIQSAALLAARLTPVQNMSVRRDDTAIVAQGSLPLPAGFWINGQARILADDDGKPRVSARLGDLPVPSPLVHGLYWGVRGVYKLRGVSLPPLDEAVSGLSITDMRVTARVNLKRYVSTIRSLSALEEVRVDAKSVASEYCRLAKLQTASPLPDLAAIIRRAFPKDHDPAKGPETLVAVSMLVVSPDVGNIAAVSQASIKSCLVKTVDATLLDRADLAKHFSLSAALTATFGNDVSQSLGIWKEVADSGPNGSGFSYIDLAADRSGMKIGEAMADPASAAAIISWLGKADDTQLLPVAQLALVEGLTEADFAQKYRNIDSRQHASVVSRIDAALEKAQPK
jgi:uncharacterized protein YfiM (DUF2279 family)